MNTKENHPNQKPKIRETKTNNMNIYSLVLHKPDIVTY